MTERLTIAELIQESHQTAVNKGWWDGGERPVGDQFANFHAEISEAWEEFRKYGTDPAWFIYHFRQTEEDGSGYQMPLHISKEDGISTDGLKPEGLAVELADLFIRVADTCAQYGIPLETALRMKLAYNRTRPYRHGNKKA